MVDDCPLCQSPKLVREILPGAGSDGGDRYHYACPDCGVDFTLESESPEAVEDMVTTLKEFMVEFRRQSH